ncbi:MAG: L-fucose/L-arabinose isomerase family protein [Candidatus Sumerlaeia bacterium]
MFRDKSRFALFFGNRGFFPSSLMKGAREEMPRILKELGHETEIMAADATNHGAVETPEEGEKYARWLAERKDRVDGVILCLPNFGDETGAVAALKDAGMPIFVQAYPDEADKMGPDSRRDSFCGKISILDVFHQYGVPCTFLKPHTVHPASPRFKENIAVFDSICRVVGGIDGMILGGIGARTTPFKTVRIDELALQRHGITVETLDMSEVFARVRKMDDAAAAYKDKEKILKDISNWDEVPEPNFKNLVKLAVVLDELSEEYNMDAMALRCWTEMQTELGVSPCVVMGVMNETGRPVACELDIGNAVAMYALELASAKPAGLLDWNNNYGDDDEKCILFHCGPMPPSMMVGKGNVTDHSIIANAVGQGCSFGCNTGRIQPGDFTFSSLLTRDGKIHTYLGEGTFTEDTIPADFFGCAGVAYIPKLQDVLIHIGQEGHRHHVSVTSGRVSEALKEAYTNYLGFNVTMPQ